MKQEMKLKIAENLQIDLTVAPYETQGLRAFIAGISGAGKSYAQMKFLEEAHDAGLQFVLLDVHGEGHVLSELSDNVVVASERFGIPVDIEAVDVYTDILESGMSLVIDLKALYWGNRKEFLKFTLQFLRKFMSKWSNIMRPILVAVDEAQEIAPQTQTKGIADLVKAVSEIVTGGRKSGVNILLASQRPAKIDKTAISQANVRLIGKMEDENDYNAVKPHLKYTVIEEQKNKKTGKIEEIEVTKTFTFQEIKKLRSGEFICSAEGEAVKIKVNKRRTKDAGKTPTVKVSFTPTQKKDMKEIADRITAAIEASKKEREQEKDQAARIKSLEKSLENEREKRKDTETKLDMVEFVAEKFGGSKVSGKVEVPAEVVDAKSEFDRELKKLRSKIQQDLREKDSIIEKLELRDQQRTKEHEEDLEFKRTFNKWLGQTGSGAAIDEDAIVSIVTREIARVGNGGTVYEVAPLIALTKDWEKRVHADILRIIDDLSPAALKILSYLLVAGPKLKSPICKTLWNTDGGNAFKKMGAALKELSGKKLVSSNQAGYGARISKVVEDYMDGLVEDPSHIVEHVVEHIRMKGGEINA